jgi:methanogenic corrinoid protein MtbC1
VTAIGKDELFERLMEVVIEFDEEEIDNVCQSVLDNGIDANDAILNGLARGMQKVGILYEDQKYGIPEVL